MDRLELETAMKLAISDHLGTTTDRIQPDSSFIDDLGADSLDMIELSLVLDDNFGLNLSDDDLDKLGEAQTFADAVDFLLPLVNDRVSAA